MGIPLDLGNDGKENATLSLLYRKEGYWLELPVLVCLDFSLSF